MQGGGSRMILRNSAGEELVDLSLLEPYEYFVGDQPVTQITYSSGKIEIEFKKPPRNSRPKVGLGKGNIFVSANSTDTVLFVSGLKVSAGTILGLQNGELVLVVKVLGESGEMTRIEVVRGYERTWVRPINFMDSCWIVPKSE